ncbi:Uncharacterised protein [Escherichia coli]|nr:Uncharacterised protein [Escherichia coli]
MLVFRVRVMRWKFLPTIKNLLASSVSRDSPKTTAAEIDRFFWA